VGEQNAVVEIGATVSAREVATGIERTWKVVQQKSAAGETGELAARTAVAQALLGHAAGETVTVTAAKPSRWTILEVVPAPAQAVRVPPDAPVAEFSRGQDTEYEDWVRSNPRSYALVYASRNGKRGYMVHVADCSHLGLDKDFTLKSTPPLRPRLCSNSRTVLERRSVDETGERPVPCGDCFG
jgi:hypothetical protein